MSIKQLVVLLLCWSCLRGLVFAGYGDEDWRRAYFLEQEAAALKDQNLKAQREHQELRDQLAALREEKAEKKREKQTERDQVLAKAAAEAELMKQNELRRKEARLEARRLEERAKPPSPELKLSPEEQEGLREEFAKLAGTPEKQKRKAEKAERPKREAEAAQQKRQLEAKIQKREAEAAEQKRLAFQKQQLEALQQLEAERPKREAEAAQQKRQLEAGKYLDRIKKRLAYERQLEADESWKELQRDLAKFRAENPQFSKTPKPTATPTPTPRPSPTK